MTLYLSILYRCQLTGHGTENGATKTTIK